MPRIRTIKPDFFTSDTVSELPLRARLTWIGLWTHCDDHGRCRDNVKLIKAAVWPLDNVSLREIEEDLDALTAQGLLFSYTADDSKNYLQVTGWAEHQKVDRPSKSTIPAPTEATRNGSRRPHPVDNPNMGQFSQVEADSRNTRETVASPREGLDLERKGKERKGADSRDLATIRTVTTPADSAPPRNCEEHQNVANPPPCGPCADARRIHQAWEADRRHRIDSAPRCPNPEHRGQLAHNCSVCRSEELAGAGRTGAFRIVPSGAA